MRNPWKWATFALVGLVGVQFWWWNKKAPQVLNLGSGRRPLPGAADEAQLGGYWR